MKTPREILRQRHQAANSKLDAVRRRALEGVGEETERDEGVSGFVAMLVSLRWHLVGLSAAWLIVALLNMDLSPASTAKMEAKTIPSPHQLMAAIRENRRQLLEVMEWPVAEHRPGEAQEHAPAPNSEAPRRRSELKDLRQQTGTGRTEMA